MNQGFRAVIVNLAAQTVNVNVDYIGGRIEAHMPHMLEDHSSSNYTACVPAKVLQQGELLRGKLQDAVTPPRFATDQIKLEIGNFQPRRFLL
jgi:hypothetical protein